ncbi:hypothetical protein HPB52_022532 [Rhipicephalus sanguineus]|uniref:Uncharacterized protein n=1 Tax=Rhipicephalus sanguineus TaxID=34632 RepID=A0A9D4PXN5_RHISA|nr:hypothetical protein HPB52_022532 [Rhipicephalus sanguineus]
MSAVPPSVKQAPLALAVSNPSPSNVLLEPAYTKKQPSRPEVTTWAFQWATRLRSLSSRRDAGTSSGQCVWVWILGWSHARSVDTGSLIRPMLSGVQLCLPTLLLTTAALPDQKSFLREWRDIMEKRAACTVDKFPTPSSSTINPRTVISAVDIKTAMLPLSSAPGPDGFTVRKLRAVPTAVLRVLLNLLMTCKEIAVADRECAAVQQKLGTMPATKRKFQAMEPDPEAAPATIEGEKCFLVQGDALSDTLSKTTRPCCLAMG